MLIFPTVRHTGSHFIIGLFGLDINKAMSWKHGGQGEYIFDHIHPALSYRFMPLMEENTIVVPLRHPKVTAVSWRDRKKDEQEMIECFDCLVEMIDPYEPHYLPVDSEQRDLWLKRLNFDLGLELETDWEPRGVKQNNHSLRHQDVQASPAVESLCERIKPFLDRFYGEPHAEIQSLTVQANQDS